LRPARGLDYGQTVAKKPHVQGKKKATPREHPRVRPLEAALLAGDGSVNEEALRVSQGLRAQDRYAEALPLARAAAGRTRAWRLEEALCALGLGDHESVRAIAARDAAIGRLLAPVLGALAGEMPAPASEPPAPAGEPAEAASEPPAPASEPAKTAGTAAEKASGSLDELALALAAVTSAAVRHDEVGAREALDRSVLKRSPSASVYRAAADLAFGRDGLIDRPALERAARRVAEDGGPAVRGAVCIELATHAPRLVLDKPRLLTELADTEEQAAEARRLALISQIRDAAHDPEHLGRLLRAATHRAFTGEARGYVALLEAFAQLSTPHLAARLLDEARASGADPIETLRGAYLVERARDQLAGREKPSAAHLAALDALARAFAAAPGGEPLAAEALFLLAMHSLDAEDGAKAEAYFQRAEALAPAATHKERLRVQLDLLQRISLEDEAGALAGVEELLVRNPTSKDVWALRIDLAPRFERDTLTVIAAESTGDEQLQIDAQAIRVRRWERTLFDGLDAPGTRPGQIAAELEAFIRTGARGATLKLLATHFPRVLAPLGEEAREALCLVLIESAWNHLDGADQLRCLSLAFRAVLDEPGSLANLTAYLLGGKDPEALGAVLASLGSDLSVDDLGTLLCAGLAVSGDSSLVAGWFAPARPRLSDEEIAAIEKDLLEVERDFATANAELDVEEIVDRANEALLPGFGIDVLSDGSAHIEEAAEAFGYDEEQVSELLTEFEELPAPARRQLLAQLEELWTQPGGEGGAKIETLLERLATGKIPRTVAEKKESTAAEKKEEP
jgi:hypothetical protein